MPSTSFISSLGNSLLMRSVSLPICLNDCLPGSIPTDQTNGIISVQPQSQPAAASSTRSSSPQQTSRPEDATHFPELPRIAILGEIPSRDLDIPITSVFLVLFIIGAIGHMITFKKNKAKGHKFFPSFLIYVFCMARMVSCVLRIAWATHPHNARLAIAAVIFVSAGVLIIFLVNLIFAQRIVRSIQPQIGWNPKLTKLFKLMFALAVSLLAIACFGIVQSFFTIDRHLQLVDRNLQLAAMSYFLFLAFMPILFVYITKVLPRTSRPEKFGAGRLRTKLRILTTAALLCTFGAAFRTGTMFMHPRRVEDPAWYHSKACFYLFNFTVEILVVYLYLFARVDQRFYIPAGAHGPGDYSGRNVYGAKGVDEDEKGSRRLSVSSYAQLLSRNSSSYTLNVWDEAEDLEAPEVSEQSDWSRSTLALPEIVHQGKMSLSSLPEAPYLDIRFEARREEEAGSWLPLPLPIFSRSFWD